MDNPAKKKKFPQVIHYFIAFWPKLDHCEWENGQIVVIQRKTHSFFPKTQPLIKNIADATRSLIFSASRGQYVKAEHKEVKRKKEISGRLQYFLHTFVFANSFLNDKHGGCEKYSSKTISERKQFRLALYYIQISISEKRAIFTSVVFLTNNN